MSRQTTPPNLNLDAFRKWQPPEFMRGIRVIDAHTEGEPLRVMVDGFETEGATVLDRRRFAQERLDNWRRALMWEPRGHADMYGCVIVPPSSQDADFGVLFLHNDGFSTMCGHGIIGVTKVALESGLLPIQAPQTTLRIETPAGPVTATAEIRSGSVDRVRFRNVPSFVDALDKTVEVPGLGPVQFDLAFGGAYYAFVHAGTLGLSCDAASYGALIRAGVAIKRAVQARHNIQHPTQPELGFLYGTIFLGPSENHHSRHVCVFANGEVDRCPTGTGVSARLAVLHARNQVQAGEEIVVESILGTRFSGKVRECRKVGSIDAIVPEISGRAWITGVQTLLFDPQDPLQYGFYLR